MKFTLHLRAYAPFDTFGGIYHGDGARRGSTTSPAVTARIYAWVSFDLAARTAGVAEARSDPSSIMGLPLKRTARPKAICRSVKVAGGLFLQLEAWGSNPLAPGAPDIDVRARLEFAVASGHLGVSGSLEGDLFPNFEVFVGDGKDQRRMILNYDTDGGRTTGPMVRLWGNRQADMGGICAAFPLTSQGLFA